MEKKDNLLEMVDKDVLAAIDSLQELLQEKHYDYLLVVGEKVKREEAGRMLEKFAMSSIVNESEVPVLPSALMGVCAMSAPHRKFVEDLLTLIVNMRSKAANIPIEHDDNGQLVN